jgi:hypothetical protein
MEKDMAQSNAQRTEPASEPAGEPSAPGRRPEFTVRVGNVEIAGWRNKGANGEFFTTSAPTIRYKDGEEWKDGSGYGMLDLLALAEAAREASAKIRELSRGKAQGR